jgi:hypothetical protein
VEGAGWREQYLIDQGTIQNRTMGGGSVTDRLYCGVNVPKLAPVHRTGYTVEGQGRERGSRNKTRTNNPNQR